MYLRHTLAGRAARLMLILALCAGWTASGEAAPVTFSFTGAVTHAGSIPADPFAGGISKGSAINGHFTFESTAADLIPDAATGLFTSHAAPYGFSVNIGAFSFSTSGYLAVTANNGVTGRDRFLVMACPEQNGVCDSLRLGLYFEDAGATVFGSDALPLTPPSLGEFEIAAFSLMGPVGGSYVEIFGNVSALTCGAGCDPVSTPVPEPGTLGMVGLAISTLIGRGARSRRRQA